MDLDTELQRDELEVRLGMLERRDLLIDSPHRERICHLDGDAFGALIEAVDHAVYVARIRQLNRDAAATKEIMRKAMVAA